MKYIKEQFSSKYPAKSPSEQQLREELIGFRFPDGTFTITEYEAWLTADAILSPSLPEGLAHPMYAYYVALGGMGMSIEELFALAYSSSGDGPMFGEGGIELRRSLRVGETFVIRGGIHDVIRKKGLSGTFDIVTFSLEVVDEDGEVVAISENSFIFPQEGVN